MKEFDKHMTIGVTADGDCGVQITPNTDCATALQLLGTLALHVANAFNAVAASEITNSQLSKSEQEAAKQGTQESIYDAMQKETKKLTKQAKKEKDFLM